MVSMSLVAGLRRRRLRSAHVLRSCCWRDSIAAPSFSQERQQGVATLAFEKVAAGEEREQVRTGIAIHGLMGAGKNLRTFARTLLSTLIQRTPPNAAGWRMILVDLRNHGNSADLEGFDPPHDINSAARDIADLIKSQSWPWPDLVLGHSLGGKVALEFGKSCAEGSYGHLATPPKQLWVLDSLPGRIDNEHSGDVEHVLKTIKDLPDPLPSRRWLINQMREMGFSKTLTEWLGSNLKQINMSDEQVTWIFNPERIYDMYTSYRNLCYWSFLENPPKGTHIGIVRAENSDRWFPAALSQLEKIVAANTQRQPDCGTLSYLTLKNAGHWLHVDNLAGLVDILSPYLI